MQQLQLLHQIKQLQLEILPLFLGHSLLEGPLQNH